MQLSALSRDSWIVLVAAGKVRLLQEGRGSVPLTEGLELSARTHTNTETSIEACSDRRKTSLCENKFVNFDTINMYTVQSCNIMTRGEREVGL